MASTLPPDEIETEHNKNVSHHIRRYCNSTDEEPHRCERTLFEINWKPVIKTTTLLKKIVNERNNISVSDSNTNQFKKKCL